MEPPSSGMSTTNIDATRPAGSCPYVIQRSHTPSGRHLTPQLSCEGPAGSLPKDYVAMLAGATILNVKHLVGFSATLGVTAQRAGEALQDQAMDLGI